MWRHASVRPAAWMVWFVAGWGASAAGQDAPAAQTAGKTIEQTIIESDWVVRGTLRVDTAVNLSHGNLLILDVREDLTGAGDNQPIRVLVPADASQLVGTEVLACLRKMKQLPGGRF